MLKNTVCQVCQVHCTLQATVENGEVREIRGDKNDPAYHGYSCIKGREVHSIHKLPSRLTHSLRLESDGKHRKISREVAASEIAAKLLAIIDRHGPRSVAMYIGTYGMCNLLTHALGISFMRAIGSCMIFQPQTIDQPGKGIAAGLHGIWLAGLPAMDEWEALLLIGTNPLVSMNGGLGPNPARNLNRMLKRGMKLVVIDPRRSETARRADLHLQCIPGEDACILAAIARELIFTEKIDVDFIASECEGLDTLRAMLKPFTPEFVAARAGVEAEEIRAAATILGTARRGAVAAGTGANMAGDPCLSEYLVRVLTSLRGWWLREGELRPNPGVLIEPLPAIAASLGPTAAYGLKEKSRVRGLAETAQGMPTATLADEILLPGEGQVKALIVLGGNPVAAWPDQLKTDAAMCELELLVCLDPRMTETCLHAHYVIAPKLQLEIETNSAANELWGSVGFAGWGYDFPYGFACPPVTKPPLASDIEEEWETIYAVARAMGLKLEVQSRAILNPQRAEEEAIVLNMRKKPTTHEMWRTVLHGSPIPYDHVMKSDHRLYRREVVIASRSKVWKGRLSLGAEPMMEDLRRVASSPRIPHRDDMPFRLISRRMNDMHNSNWHDNPRQRRRFKYNPAFIHPEDLREIGVVAGELIEISSQYGKIVGVAEPDPELRRGCVSMSNGWGAAPGKPGDPCEYGANTSRLTATDVDWDRYCGIPIMSAIPVRISSYCPAKR